MIWVVVSLLLALGSALTGTSPEFVALQAGICFSVLGIWTNLRNVSFIVFLILASTVAKNFLVSQPIKLFLLQPADSFLLMPDETAAAILVAMLGALLAAFLWKNTAARFAFPGVMPVPESRQALQYAGYIFLVIGFAGLFLSVIVKTESVVSVYLSKLVFSSTIAFIILKYRETAGERIFSPLSAFPLVMLILLGFGGASKGGFLMPIAFVGAIYIYFQKLPPKAAILGFLLVGIITVSFLHPVINYVRRVAPPGQTASVLVEVIADAALDPAKLEYIKSVSDQIEGAWKDRLYYGGPMGFLNRFSPSQIDVLVSSFQNTQLGMSYVISSIGAVVPQTFGAKRQVGVGQSDIESTITRRETLGTNNANYGIVGILYSIGGYPGIFIGMFAIVSLLLSSFYFMFGARNSVWAFAFFPHLMFSLADGTLATLLIFIVHGFVIMGGTMFIVFAIIRTLFGTKRVTSFDRGTPALG